MFLTSSNFESLRDSVYERVSEQCSHDVPTIEDVPVQVFLPFNVDGTILSVGKMVVSEKKYCSINTYTNDYISSLSTFPVKTYRSDFMNAIRDFGEDYLKKAFNPIPFVDSSSADSTSDVK